MDRGAHQICVRFLLCLVVILFYSIIASHFAHWHWILDLFSHFQHQYFIGAFGLAIILAPFRYYITSLFCFILSIIVALNIYTHIEILPHTETHPNHFKILQFNHLVHNTDLTDFESWLSNQDDPFDVLILQEANTETVAMAERLKTIYPHAIHKPNHRGAFGKVILSRYAFLEQNIIPIKGVKFENFLARIKIKPDYFKTPITIYALHTLPPMNSKQFTQRNQELTKLAKAISKDASENIIAIGDWNITPYSPHFKKMLRQTDLKLQITEFYPTPTWPSLFGFKIFQIPIDHILSKGKLKLMNKKRGKNFGSDHYLLHAEFKEIIEPA